MTEDRRRGLLELGGAATFLGLWVVAVLAFANGARFDHWRLEVLRTAGPFVLPVVVAFFAVRGVRRLRKRGP